MSVPHQTGCNCDPEVVFELADRGLDPGREREILAHLNECPECRELYQRELDLNVFLNSLEFAELRSRSVCQRVAMALPTRQLKARLLWSVLAGALLLVALLALDLNGVSPAVLFADAVGVFEAYTFAFGNIIQAVFAVAGSVLLVALAIGALLDLILAGAIFSVARRRARA